MWKAVNFADRMVKWIVNDFQNLDWNCQSCCQNSATLLVQKLSSLKVNYDWDVVNNDYSNYGVPANLSCLPVSLVSMITHNFSNIRPLQYLINYTRSCIQNMYLQ